MRCVACFKKIEAGQKLVKIERAFQAGKDGDIVAGNADNYYAHFHCMKNANTP